VTGEGDAIEVQVLEDDLREIRALAGPGPEERTLAALVVRGLERFQVDEATWQTLQGRDNPAALEAQSELKRRETIALLISMRARTIASELRMNVLGRRVQELERRHAERLGASTQLRRDIESLERRIARLEAALRGGEAPGHGHRRPSWAERLARFLSRGRR
jgi:hypothetical protein